MVHSNRPNVCEVTVDVAVDVCVDVWVQGTDDDAVLDWVVVAELDLLDVIYLFIPRDHVSWHSTHMSAHGWYMVSPPPPEFRTFSLDQTAKIPQNRLIPGYNRKTGRKIVQKP